MPYPQAPHPALARLTLGLAAIGLAIAPPAAHAANDPCAGGLAAAQIIECLKPDSMTAATRGVRPAAPRPAGMTANAPPQTTQTASVNLLVPFAYDSADMTDQGRAALNALATALKDGSLANARFEIAGHTDAAGGDAYNKTLSERRANTARDYLVAAGIDPTHLVAAGYGRTRLYDPNAPMAAINRRVQVTRLP